jgi:hypothetical protein
VVDHGLVLGRRGVLGGSCGCHGGGGLKDVVGRIDVTMQMEIAI